MSFSEETNVLLVEMMLKITDKVRELYWEYLQLWQYYRQKEGMMEGWLEGCKKGRGEGSKGTRS